MIDLTCRDFKLIRRALRSYQSELKVQQDNLGWGYMKWHRGFETDHSKQISEVEKILKVLEAYKQ